MSYNIDSWKTIVLDDLKIDYDKLLLTLKQLDCLSIISHSEEKININLGEYDGLVGHLADDMNNKIWFVVDKVNIGGTASNRDFNIFQRLVRYSSGKLVALLIWEAGDSISCFYSNGGAYKEYPIDELIADWVKKSFPYIMEK